MSFYNNNDRPRAPGPRQGGGGGGPPPNNNGCYKCGGRGHISKFCTAFGNSNGNVGRPGPSAAPVGPGGSFDYAQSTEKSAIDPKKALEAIDQHAKKLALRTQYESSAVAVRSPVSADAVSITNLKYKEGLRIAFGMKGQAMNVATNHLELTLPSRIYIYKVEMIRKFFAVDDLNNVVVARSADKKLVLAKLQQMVPELKKTPRRWVSDGDLIWSTELLWSPTPSSKGHVFGHNDLVYDNECGVKLVLDRVFISYLRDIDTTQKIADIFFDPMPAKYDDSTSAILTRGLNAFLTANVRSNTAITSVGSNRSFGNAVGHSLNQPGSAQLCALTGFFISARPGIQKMLININTATSPFFAQVTVAEFIDRSHAAGRSWSDTKSALKGVQVRIKYNTKEGFKQEVNRMRLITEVSDQYANQLLVSRNTTLKCWYQQATTSPKFPQPPISVGDWSACINVGRSRSYKGGQFMEWYPAECLDIVQFAPYRARLTSDETTQILRTACQSPQTNANQILNRGLSHFAFNGSKQGGLSDFGGMRVGQKLLAIEGRKLPPPTVRYADGKDLRIQHASWNLIDSRFASPANVRALPLLNLSGQPVPPEFQKTMRHALFVHGLIKSEDVPFEMHGTPKLQYDPSPEFEDCIQKAFEALKSRHEATVLVIIPQFSYDVYAAIKRVAELKLGIKTVCCIAAKHLFKFSPQTASNIALKYNIKGVGDNHHLGPHDLAPIRRRGADNKIDTIVLGADVGHAGTGSSPGAPSVAAVVGSVDSEFMQFPGSMRLQPKGQEFIQELADMVVERLLNWHSKHGKLPTRVLFYRDGVSESQYEAVRAHEIPQIKDAFYVARTYLDTNTRPSLEAIKANRTTTTNDPFELTFLIVGKRHNTRFYPLTKDSSFPKNKAGALNGNIQPGFVVDQVITHPFAMDFYLQSHNPIQGTGRSAHYYVLTNTMRLSADDLQAITHAFCYTYARATKGVSYCAPAYYADRLCDRGRAYLRHWIVNVKEWDAYQPYRRREKDEMVSKYNEEIASDLATRPYYQPHQGTPWQYGMPRKNPWKPELDGCMFYL